ncbi:hypothetical protein [Leptospira interrogans]|uniref:hypothetical protein n=1 Tax=Leptospira interrogans TaxID=173 RepID=UPI00029795C4|nr:hypothetical protein [Leptospira interrogans]EKP23629.1 hypothetical protein LEP1GSC117_2252 [Leptospira interrogans serovar Icterohaemorrhagiae str. Verdun LP]EKP78014.1 hypothetical protein LEP1GSC173_0340 [Leptospira interrogans str. HAI1594]EMO18898.1 hypothetical protein LEP1GSC167_3152 [Leptospira interrogans serovar Copenhageni str. HAI0188]EMO37207.1 hypothetical protein LEP1GSC177_1541 [Leptospira interrogans str. MMD3731]EMY54161.1 hypothetical protein LEP1GSC204_2330 [Leptospira 
MLKNDRVKFFEVLGQALSCFTSASDLSDAERGHVFDENVTGMKWSRGRARSF